MSTPVLVATLKAVPDTKNVGFDALKRAQKARYAWFYLVSFCEGLINAFEVLQVIYLTEHHGISLSLATLAAGVTRVPTLARLAFGILSDKYSPRGLGHRKPYIFVGLLCAAVGFFTMGFVELNAYLYTSAQIYAWYFGVCLFILSAYAVHDGATDGFVVECVPHSEVGKVQGTMTGLRSAAVIFGFTSYATLADSAGWHVVFFVMGVGLLVSAIFLLLTQEVPADQRKTFTWAAFESFRRRDVQAFCVFMFLLTIPLGSTFVILPVYIEDVLGYSTEESGFVMAVAAVGGVIGAPITGYCIDRWRERLSLTFYAAFAMSVVAVPGFILSEFVPGLIWIFSLFGGLYAGMMSACVFGLGMLLTNPAIASSFFAILVTVWTGGEVIGLSYIGAVVVTTNYRVAWIVTWLFILLALPPLICLFRHFDVNNPQGLPPIDDIYLSNTKKLEMLTDTTFASDITATTRRPGGKFEPRDIDINKFDTPRTTTDNEGSSRSVNDSKLLREQLKTSKNISLNREPDSDSSSDTSDSELVPRYTNESAARSREEPNVPDENTRKSARHARTR